MRKALLFALLALAAAAFPPGRTLADDDSDSDSDGAHVCGEHPGRGQLEMIGLTNDQRLICFNERQPRKADDIGAVTGLSGDSRLVGIDFRPATGDLYGVGNAGGVYTLDPATAVATFRSQLNVALAGTSFGVDFNPTVDRLRIISDGGQNLRANVDTGATTVDTPLNYAPMTTALGVTGAAYTNNDTDANTATTLFDIDSLLDQVAIQAPPNAGGLNPTGKLGVDTSDAIGFDIYSTVRNGSTLAVQGFAALTTGGSARLFKINLLTGKASPRGNFSAGDQVIGLAIPLNQL